jgi:hypothetical protein
MLLAAGLPVAAWLGLTFRGKTTQHLPPAFAAIGKALAISGEFRCCPLHQFGVDVLPLLQLLHAGQHFLHFSEFLLVVVPICISGQQKHLFNKMNTQMHHFRVQPLQ